MIDGYRVLGIDPNLERTGWAIVDEYGACLRSGTVGPDSPKGSARVRGNQIAYKLAQMLPELNPSHVFCEEPLMFGQVNISIKLAQLNGAIGMGVAVQSIHRLVVADLNVTEWRKAMGFHFERIKNEKQHARTTRLKAAITRHAEARFPGVQFANPDAAEAALIALRGLMHVSGVHPIAVKPRKVRKPGAKSKTRK